MEDNSDYVDSVINTVRQHKETPGAWSQWANALADEVERLRGENFAEQEKARLKSMPERLRAAAAASIGDPEWLTGHGLVPTRDLLNEAAEEVERLHELARMTGWRSNV